jgi:hypothetical protein
VISYSSFVHSSSRYSTLMSLVVIVRTRSILEIIIGVPAVYLFLQRPPDECQRLSSMSDARFCFAQKSETIFATLSINFGFKLSITNESLGISRHNQDALPIESYHCYTMSSRRIVKPVPRLVGSSHLRIAIAS